MVYDWQRQQALLWKRGRKWYVRPAITVHQPRRGRDVDAWIGYGTAALGGVLITLLVLGW